MFARLWRVSFPLVWLVVAVVMTTARPALAQIAATVNLSLPDIQDFPLLTAYLDVHDGEENFVHGLQLADVSVLEDGVELLVSDLEELQPGVQYVIAIAPGASFSIRDAQGISRFDYLRKGMAAWDWEQLNTGTDNLSLVTDGGPEVAHASDPADILEALQAYQPAERNADPNLEILSRAIQLASDPTPHQGMEQVVLFITSPQLTNVTLGMQSLMGQADQQGIRISVWLLAAADYFGLPEVTQLRAFTEQTNGRFFGFSGSEQLPDLEGYLEPLRNIYRLGYTSQITTPGSHEVSAQVTVGGTLVASPIQSFEINLQAPRPVFVSPPLLIQRSLPTQVQDSNLIDPAELIPVEQQLEVLIDFPDGYERPLVRTTLYVDGAIAAENTAPPFELFTWDLRGYSQSSDHVLQAEALDGLGLSSLSAETTIQVTVPRPEQNILSAFLRQKWLIVGIIVLLSASLLVLVLIVGGRIRPRALVGQPGSVRSTAHSRPHLGLKEMRKRLSKPSYDPVTQPVETAAEPSHPKGLQRLPAWINRLHWPQRHETPQPLARLIPLVESGEATLPAPLPIESDVVTLGRDPLQANIVLEDPSVEGRHAILIHKEGAFWLEDAGSVAGTWVNYTLVGGAGTRLEHNDLIHIGRVAFRFILREPGRLPKPIVILEEQAQ